METSANKRIIEQMLGGRLGAVVLCGGMSRRMGQCKAWLSIGGETLLTRTVREMCMVAGSVVVAKRPGQRTPNLECDVTVVEDKVEDRGPLAGICAGMAALSGRCEAAFIASCDHPFLTARFAEKLVSLLGCHQAVIPVQDGYWYPLTALYRLSAATLAEAALASGRLAPREWAAQCHARLVDAGEWDDVEVRDGLRNVNTKADYEWAVSRSASQMHEARQSGNHVGR